MNIQVIAYYFGLWSFSRSEGRQSTVKLNSLTVGRTHHRYLTYAHVTLEAFPSDGVAYFPIKQCRSKSIWFWLDVHTFSSIGVCVGYGRHSAPVVAMSVVVNNDDHCLADRGEGRTLDPSQSCLALRSRRSGRHGSKRPDSVNTWITSLWKKFPDERPIIPQMGPACF